MTLLCTSIRFAPWGFLADQIGHFARSNLLCILATKNVVFFIYSIADTLGNTLFFRDTLKPVVFNPKTASIRGWPQFISHDDLLRDEKYLPDDVLHVRATVSFLIGTSPSSCLSVVKEENPALSLSRDFDALYRSKKNTDVTLVSSDGKSVSTRNGGFCMLMLGNTSIRGLQIDHRAV